MSKREKGPALPESPDAGRELYPCDCCDELDATFRYLYATIPGAHTQFCAKHLRFFDQCAGKVVVHCARESTLED